MKKKTNSCGDVGRKIGLLTIVAILPERPSVPHERFYAYCECGKEIVLTVACVLQGIKQDCGCLAKKKEFVGNIRKSESYTVWLSMKGRCLNKTDNAYADYGGRGISICDRWMVFENFINDMGERPSRLFFIDRINNEGNYEPGNVRWTTRTEQNQNTRSAKWFTGFGKRQNISQWATEYGLTHTCVSVRLRKNGGDIEKALHAPVGAAGRKRGKRTSKYILTYDGITLPLVEWAKELGISYRVLWQRMKRGEPVQNVLARDSLQKKWQVAQALSSFDSSTLPPKKTTS